MIINLKIRYFDNAATTKVKEEVLQEMLPYFNKEFGNPSAMYSIARNAKKAVENARFQVADLINADKKEIYFTASGSESDNTAIKGFAYANREKGNHIITTKIEHPAILETCKSLEKQGFVITYLNVDEEGLINLQEFENSITDRTILISIMFANNEIGTIQKIEKIAQIAKSRNIFFHTDAVQAVGNVLIDVKKMGIDMLSMSGHKINGPKGVGALYVKKDIKFERIIDGGHQEKNKRAGTENIAGIVGIGKACEIAKHNMDYHIEYLTKARNYYIKEVQRRIPNIKINGSINYRLPGNSNISFAGIDAGELLLRLDSYGICASSGSACSTGQVTSSHVLRAIGLTEDYLYGAIRVTFSEENTRDDVDFLVQVLEKEILSMRNGY